MIKKLLLVETICVAVLLIAPISVGAATSVSAADALKTKYTAQLIDTTTDLVVAPGAAFEVKVKFKNTGSVTWKETDKNYLTLYTYEPKYRASVFADKSWGVENRVMRFKGAAVKPGAIATLTMKLKAPQKEGAYREGFNLAANDLLWIPGGKFALNITVVKPGKEVVKAPAPMPAPVANPSPVPGSVSKTYQASVLIRSTDKVSARGGETVSYLVGVKNAGANAWPSYALAPQSPVQIAAVSLADIRSNDWPKPELAVSAPATEVLPGRLAIIPFTFKAPAKKGEYTLVFNLKVGEENADGGVVEIPVSVTSDANVPVPVPSQAPVAGLGPEEPLEPEPMLRVGLYKTNGEVITTDRAFTIQDSDGIVLLNMPANSMVTLTYDNGGYKALSDQALTAISTKPLRAVGVDGQAIFTVPSHENRPSWNTSYNDNQFRGVLELRYSQANATVWLINELPIDQYVKGLVEASDRGPTEYLKTMHTAARSYAYFHYSTKSKHRVRGFDVDASYDQVYRGYGAERRQPNISAAVEATRGMVVRYQGGLALTQYSARTAGRSLSHQEAFGGTPIPYLVSVPLQYDAGKVMWGHGVGISAEDAAARAKAEGLNYIQLLKYYYTGVDVVRKW